MYSGTGQLYSGMGETWYSVVTDAIRETFSGPIVIPIAGQTVVIPGLGPPREEPEPGQVSPEETDWTPYIIGGILLYLLLRK